MAHLRGSTSTKWGVVLLLSAVIVTILVYGPAGIRPAHAQEPTPPPGDCWNEALSRDPLHCYMLEEAQRAGEIKVTAVYLAPGGGPLHIFLEQTTPITDEVAQLFEAKAHEWMETVNPFTDEYKFECGGYTGDERKDCFNSFLDHPFWREFGMRLPGAFQHHALSLSNIYENILIHVGGSEERRSVPGWASWRQVWPASAPGPSGSGGFDVSDVDLTNIPDPECETDFPGINIMNQSCHAWQLDRSLGVAGVKDEYDVQYDANAGGVVETLEAVYVQLKVSDPDDEEEMQALRDKLHPDTFGPDWEVVTIPVKYDFGEMWRWSVVLDRFAVSAGNTVGITGGAVTYNVPGDGSNYEPLVWMNGVEPLGRDDTGSDWDWSAARTTLMVWAVDPPLAAAALPDLLPELGVPADAVGLVLHDNTTPEIVTYAAGSGGTAFRVLDTLVRRIKPPAREEDFATGSVGPAFNEAYATTDPGLEAPAVQRPSTPDTNQDSATTPGQQSVFAAASGEQARLEPKATASQTDRGDTRELNRQATGDVTSSDLTDSSWLLMGVAGAAILALAVSAILLGVRLAKQRA